MDIVVNYWAIIAAAIASFLIGWAWYSPLLFISEFVALSHRTAEEMQAGGKAKMIQSMILRAVLTLLTAYVLAHFVVLLNVTTLMGALELGFWIWLGFYATVQMSGYLWEGRPFKLYIIQAGQTLVCTLVMAAIIGLWR